MVFGGLPQNHWDYYIGFFDISVEQVIAMYPYTAQNDDELTFQKDAVISVINKDDADWWKGELNGVQGVFPSNYVQSVSEHRADASPSPAPTACK